MIEPYVSEKQCKTCGECKPLTMFSPSKGGTQPYCKPCRSDRQSRRNMALRKTTRHKSPDRIEIWRRPDVQLALDVELRLWPATPCAALGLRP